MHLRFYMKEQSCMVQKQTNKLQKQTNKLQKQTNKTLETDQQTPETDQQNSRNRPTNSRNRPTNSRNRLTNSRSRPTNSRYRPTIILHADGIIVYHQESRTPNLYPHYIDDRTFWVTSDICYLGVCQASCCCSSSPDKLPTLTMAKSKSAILFSTSFNTLKQHKNMLCKLT